MAQIVKDPVCGMPVSAETGLTAIFHDQMFYFCSELCQQTFLDHPEWYAGGPVIPVMGGPTPDRHIAYFSMEVGVDSRMPTYSGGLGILAGDTLKSCADLRIPVVAVSLLYTHGYFDQELDEWGNQRERPVTWTPSDYMHVLSPIVQVPIEHKTVWIRAWQYDIRGCTGYVVPLILLDTDFEDNQPADRDLTGYLYGGDERYRLMQEIILGIGGVRMLRALGYTEIRRFHMNEGHASLLTIELLRMGQHNTPEWDFNRVRNQCVFTTHTSVPAGHDQFDYGLAHEVLGDFIPADIVRMLGGPDRLNMTRVALNLSTYINGVAKKHGEVSHDMFPLYPIDSITNGVHSRTWTCDSFRRLYDRHIPGWTNDPFSLRYAVNIPKQEVWEAHAPAKARLIAEIRQRTSMEFKEDVLTIGFARRATQYKRADLIFTDSGQLRDIASAVGPIQLVFAGKAHPKDEPGKEIIRRIFQTAQHLKDQVKIVYLEGYDMDLSKLLTSGVDLWLNTPLRPLEASGTSGMKAAHNGVPSFSVLDGWWLEGYLEGITGWSIGTKEGDPIEQTLANQRDASALYDKLRSDIIPLYYRRRDRWIDTMRYAIAFNASFFNTHRMVQQYAANAYL